MRFAVRSFHSCQRLPKCAHACALLLTLFSPFYLKTIQCIIFRAVTEQAGSGHSFLAIPISTLRGWYPETHPAVLLSVSNIASRAIVQFKAAGNIPLRRHAALLVRNMVLVSFQAALVFCLYGIRSVERMMEWMKQTARHRNGDEDRFSPSSSLPHVRSSVWHLRRNLLFHLST